MSEPAGLQMKYFVLKPAGNDVEAAASRAAMLTYSRHIGSTDAALAASLIEWAAKEFDKAYQPPSENCYRDFSRLLQLSREDPVVSNLVAAARHEDMSTEELALRVAICQSERLAECQRYLSAMCEKYGSLE